MSDLDDGTVRYWDAEATVGEPERTIYGQKAEPKKREGTWAYGVQVDDGEKRQKQIYGKPIPGAC